MVSVAAMRPFVPFVSSLVFLVCKHKGTKAAQRYGERTQ